MGFEIKLWQAKNVYLGFFVCWTKPLEPENNSFVLFVRQLLRIDFYNSLKQTAYPSLNQ